MKSSILITLIIALSLIGSAVILSSNTKEKTEEKAEVKTETMKPVETTKSNFEVSFERIEEAGGQRIMQTTKGGDGSVTVYTSPVMPSARLDTLLLQQAIQIQRELDPKQKTFNAVVAQLPAAMKQQ